MQRTFREATVFLISEDVYIAAHLVDIDEQMTGKNWRFLGLSYLTWVAMAHGFPENGDGWSSEIEAAPDWRGKRWFEACWGTRSINARLFKSLRRSPISWLVTGYARPLGFSPFVF